MLKSKDLGLLLASTDDKEQAELLNAAGYHLRMLCETSFRFEGQCYAITQHLNVDGRNFVRKLAEMLGDK